MSSRNAHGHIARPIFLQKIQGKCRMPRPQRLFCASLRGRNAHGHVTGHKRTLMRKFRGKVPDTPSSTPVLCKLAQSKCTWACHKTHFWQKCSGKMPPTPDTMSTNQRALAQTRRTLSAATLLKWKWKGPKVELSLALEFEQESLPTSAHNIPSEQSHCKLN